MVGRMEFLMVARKAAKKADQLVVYWAVRRVGQMAATDKLQNHEANIEYYKRIIILYSSVSKNV